LQDGLRQILRDPLKLAWMGKNLEKFTLENFCWDSIVKKHLNYFEEILRNNKK